MIEYLWLFGAPAAALKTVSRSIASPSSSHSARILSPNGQTIHHLREEDMCKLPLVEAVGDRCVPLALSIEQQALRGGRVALLGYSEIAKQQSAWFGTCDHCPHAAGGCLWQPA